MIAVDAETGEPLWTCHTDFGLVQRLWLMGCFTFFHGELLPQRARLHRLLPVHNNGPSMSFAGSNHHKLLRNPTETQTLGYTMQKTSQTLPKSICAAMKSLARVLTLFGVVPAILLIVGTPVGAQTQSQMDYDSDDDRLIEISSLEQLDAVRYDLDGNGVSDDSDKRADYLQAFPSPVSRMGCPAGGCDGYELTGELDFNDPTSYASGLVDRGWSKGEGDEGWLPIGSHFVRFTSTLEGNDYTLANLYIYRDASYVGLFGGISSEGSIRRFGLVEANVSGNSRVGPLAGGNGGTVIDCYATGNVTGNGRVGGLVGSNDERYGTIIDSHSTASVSGDGATGGLAGGNWYTIIGSHATGDVWGTDAVGGLAGWNDGPVVTSYATGNVTGTISVGGLVGSNRSRIISSYASGNVWSGSGESRAGGLVGANLNTIRGSYATGSVSGGTLVGGLVGANFVRSTIISSYAAGAVSGQNGIGGLVGYSRGTSVVIGSYSVGRVSGGSRVGGLIGWDAGSRGTSDSYWNIETSDQAKGVGTNSVSGAEGKTTSELQTPTSYAGIYVNWNTDIDDADGDGYETTGADDPWDFGRDNQYPALRADFDGDGEATWEEFGSQPREGLPPSQTEPPPRPTIVEAPPVKPPGSCTDGIVVENPNENPGLVSDCTVLLNGRDVLAGRATLNWSTDLPIARWQGVTVQGFPPRVVELQLVSRSLSGQIPPKFGNLAALKVLSFRVNDLRGGIPPELAGLSELRMLDLHGNSLGGFIPPELGNLSKLEALDLTANDLTGSIPPEFGNLSALKVLSFRINHLRGGIPPELGNLSKLEALDLNANRLTGSIPPELNRLSNLERLDLSQNRLSGSIPRELSSLSSLQHLILHQNDLTGPIPPELAELSRLEVLFIRANRLTGSIPPELGSLTNLRTLNLSENRLTGQIPQELANLSGLYSLWLRDNQLTGGIPNWLSGLSRLGSLDLARNQLTGPIPAGLGDLSSLTRLYLRENSLTGTIPSELGKLRGLQDLLLDHNELTGPIPQEFDNLLNLKVLGLSHNDLTGDIPRGLGKLSELWALLLQNNRLTGSLPPELGNLKKLQILYLSDNSLSGSIPPEFTGLSGLVEFHVTGNDLTGCVPWHLANKLQLEIKHDGLPKCPPPVAEGGMFSIEASRLLEDDSLTIVAVSDAVNGRALLEGTTLTYTHDGSETVSDSFTYTAVDGIHAFMVTVTVTVTPVNDSPIGVADTASVDEGGTLSLEASALLDNDTDAEDDPLSIVAVGGAVNGTVFLDGTTIIYEHDGSETTTDSLSYSVSDGTDAVTAMVTITVNPGE